MKRIWLLAGAVVLGLPHGAIAKPREVWTVVRTSDPITGASTCTVSAYDQGMFGGRYSRTGYLYPVVERNSQFGLLVGVSTGGSIRVPSGNVVWRVDDRPFRTLRAADNPPDPRFQFPVAKTGNAAVDEQVAQSMKSVSGMMSTSTVASGKIAEEILAELVGGRSLISGRGSRPGLWSPVGPAISRRAIHRGWAHCAHRDRRQLPARIGSVRTAGLTTAPLRQVARGT